MKDIVVELFPHTLSFKGIQLCADSKIHRIQEEGDSSHVNQAHDKYVYVQDKAANQESLVVLRKKTFYNKGVVDQWGMIHVGIFLINLTST